VECIKGLLGKGKGRKAKQHSILQIGNIGCPLPSQKCMVGDRRGMREGVEGVKEYSRGK